MRTPCSNAPRFTALLLVLAAGSLFVETLAAETPAAGGPRPGGLDLGEITAGGDGSGTATPQIVGVDPRNGQLVGSYVDGPLAESDPEGDGVNPSAVPGSPYIDSVFFLTPTGQVFGQTFPLAITQSGVVYEFPIDAAGSNSWNHILRDRNGGASAPPIVVGGSQGGEDPFNSAVGIHSSTGITYDLNALRARHGPERVGCFSAFWGLGNCQAGEALLIAILSSDLVGPMDQRSFHAVAGSGEFVTMEIPPQATYLTLATGALGADFCDSGTYAQAWITESPCLFPSLAELVSVEPSQVSTAGGTGMTVRGRNLSPNDAVRIGGQSLLNPVRIDSRTVVGTSPPLGVGLHTVDVVSGQGLEIARLRNAVQATAPIPPPVIASVEPPLVSSLGGTQVEVVGQNFRAGQEARIGGILLQNPVIVSATRIRGTTSALAVGSHAVEVREAALDYLATLANAVEAAPPAVVASVEPRDVFPDGTTQVEIRGQNFRAETEVKIGLLGLTNPGPPSLNGTRITAFAPPLAAGAPLGPRDVVASDSRGISTLAGGVNYIPPPLASEIPGPQELEESLAEGTARFYWFNPVAYSEILVLGSDDQILKRLPGDTAFLEIEAGGKSEVPIRIQGVVAEGIPSSITEGLAALLGCTRPPPLSGEGKPGKIDLSLRGGHAPAEAPGGGEAARAAPGGGGSGLVEGTIGHVVTHRDLSPILAESNSLTTAFSLESDAGKLEIAGFYQKIATGFGVELRGKLTHVYPEDGFTDEIAFPDILLDQPKEWNGVDYQRTGGAKIPGGDYLLDLYVVGGDAKKPYVIFADDGRNFELLVPGVPCPPYPLVKVTDLTGFATLPVLSLDKPKVNKFFIVTKACPGRLNVTFTARGTWSDEAGDVHSIVPGDSSYVPTPHFEYRWKIEDGPAETSSGSSNTLTTCLPDWGCYTVQIIVRHKICNFEKRQSFEAILYPDKVDCDAKFNSFLFPTPDPGSISGVIGLSSPSPGKGRFETPRRIEFRVLAVPKCCGDPKGIDACPSPVLADLDFRLATLKCLEGSPICTKFVYEPIFKPRVEDKCPDSEAGPKFFHVTIDDLGAIPILVDALAYPPYFKNIYLVAKTTKAGKDAGDVWHPVGAPLSLTNRPQVLERSFWSGRFDPRGASYHFIAKSSQDSQKNLAMPPSSSIKLPDLPVTVPSYQNGLSSGFTSRFFLRNKVWKAEDGSGITSGEVLSNKLDSAAVTVKPRLRDGTGGAGGGEITPPVYEWCHEEEILKHRMNQKLFEAILYTGTIGPVPVTVFASISLGLEISVEAFANVVVSPFKAIDEEGTLVSSDFFLLSSIDLRIPCQIRADVLFGIASVAARLVPSARFDLDAHVGSHNDKPVGDVFVRATMDLFFEVEACLNYLIDKVCYSPGRIKILKDQPLIPQYPSDGKKLEPKRCAGGGGAEEIEEGGGADSSDGIGGSGGGLYIPIPTFMATSKPTVAVHFDGKTTLKAYVRQDGLAKVLLDDFPLSFALGDGHPIGTLRDPAAVFISGDEALIAWTRSYADEAGIGTPVTLADRNKLAAQEEIIITPVLQTLPSTWRLQTSRRIADPASEVPDLLKRRADGSPSIAADLPAGEALVAWVRYETVDFLVPDGLNARPQIEKTAIYVRRVDASGTIGAAVRISTPGTGIDGINGINIEPCVAISPSGNTAYCVWVHDSTPGHVDLIQSNKGRKLLYSVFSKSTGAWSAPKSVLADPTDYDDLYPGVLRPQIALKGDATGLLTFDALEAGASDRDTGLGGGSRSFYAQRLEGGVFAVPELIHGKCQAAVYGEEGIVKFDIPVITDPEGFEWEGPEWVLIFHGTGSIGTREGSGNVLVSVLGEGMGGFTTPLVLTKDDSVHSNIVADVGGGVLRTLNLNGGSSRFLESGGGGVDEEPRFDSIDVRLEADAAIAGCLLSDPFSAPGSPVAVRVLVENSGLAGTPRDRSGRSAVGIRLSFIAEDGSERVIDGAELPELQPGESRAIEFTLEMPHDPVRLRADLDPNPIDRDLTNNARECLLGAPMPRDLACRWIELPDEAQTLAAELGWTNPAIYDEVILYRDGSMFAALPGASTSFVDIAATPSEHEYIVRGRIGASRSARTFCRLGPPEPEGPPFRRGDVDANASVDITDAIVLLGYLFLGAGAPSCLDAGDADDTGQLDITDAIRILGYLFLGGEAPGAPGPLACGSDDTADGLDCRPQPECLR